MVLVLADLSTFWLLREVYRQVVESHAITPRIAESVRAVLPPGYVRGWQLAIALMVGLLVTGAFGPGDQRRDAGRLFAGAALGAGLTLWGAMWTRGVDVVALQFAITTLGVWLVLVSERLILDRFIVRPRLAVSSERLLFIGTPADVAEAQRSPAFLPFGASGAAQAMDAGDLHAESAAALSRLHQAIVARRAEALVVCGGIPDGVLQSVVDAARMHGCRLLATSHVWNVAGVNPVLHWLDGEPVLELTTPSVEAPQLLLKRIVDFVAAAMGIALLAPAGVVLAVLVKLSSPGPVFFRSERWGQFGRRIRIWKFRTMVHDAQVRLRADPLLAEAYARNVKLADDPRVTTVGRWLRRLSIDELPQLFNVLMGEMSLVGPRPKLIEEAPRYGSAFPVVLSVPPGITGLWQISGRSDVSYEERIALDVDYVRRCSLALDVAILARTLPVVLRGVGAH